MEALFVIIQTNPEVKYMIYDISRLLTLQIFTQFMISMNNTSVSFLSGAFIQTTLFLCIGIMIYWLILYKINPFKGTESNEDNVLKNKL